MRQKGDFLAYFYLWFVGWLTMCSIILFISGYRLYDLNVYLPIWGLSLAICLIIYPITPLLINRLIRDPNKRIKILFDFGEDFTLYIYIGSPILHGLTSLGILFLMAVLGGNYLELFNLGNNFVDNAYSLYGHLYPLFWSVSSIVWYFIIPFTGLLVEKYFQFDYKANKIPIPNQELNKEIKKIYSEAAAIVKPSPRASSALLRLCLEELLIQIEIHGNTLNERIGNLIDMGVDKHIRKACDLVRVHGNEAVHPREINMKDDEKIARSLFWLINKIANVEITEKKEIDKLFDETISKNAKKSILKRDQKKEKKTQVKK
ncbi:hypothetical protein LCGC14_1673950 [marine sediment metagenome]|uniref:DUF4145 domain-containing protein n=1 Tax=marine sediment metagenome TaxID=412755 RepID=A0A0F9K6E0_9ZZZZ